MPKSFELEITPATQYATVYSPMGQALATVQRKRVLEKGAEWAVYRLDGSLVFRAVNERTLRDGLKRWIEAGQPRYVDHNAPESRS